MDKVRYNEKKGELKQISFIPVVTIEPTDKDVLFGKAFFLIVLSMLLATLTAISYLVIFQPTEEGALFKESQYGGVAAIYNFVLMLIFVIAFTLIIYLMIKKELFNILTILQGFLMGLISGSIGGLFLTLWSVELFFILVELKIIFPINENLLINFVITFQYVAFVLLFIITFISIISPKYNRLRNIVMLFTASVAGSYFGLSLGLITPIILLAGFALYDIIAVFKGPLKLISDELKNYMEEEKQPEEKRGLMIGLGDLFFYSLSLGYTLAFLTFSAFMLVLLSLLIGYMLTIKMVLDSSERRALPALPLPILLALMIIITFYFL